MFLVRIICLLLVCLAPKAIAKDVLDILAIHSYHESFIWTSKQFDDFKSQLNKNLPQERINYSVEYLNAKHLEITQPISEQFKAYLTEKYQLIQPDLIYVTDDTALETLLNNPPAFLKNIPIVFSGIDNLTALNDIQYQEITGVFESEYYEEYLQLAKTLFPAAKQILLLGDSSSTDDIVAQQLEEFNLKNNKTLPLIHIRAKQLDQLVEQLKTYPEAIFLTGTVGSLSTGNKLVNSEKLLSELNQLGNPILMTGQVKAGALGGLQPKNSYGEVAADLATQVILGKQASKVPKIYHTDSELVLYWDKLKELGITLPKSLAKSATILNKPDSFIKRNQTILLWISVIFCLFAIICILAFVWIIQQRNKVIKEQFRDSLTDCANRPKLIQDLKYFNNNLALIDINDFRILNNFYGNQVGDRLLQEFARILKAEIVSKIRIYRAYGDIFALLFPDDFTQSQSIRFIENLISRIENYVFFSGDLNISITVVVGISSCNGKQRINEATTALNNAKQDRKSCAIYQHNSSLQEKQLHNAIWSRKLKSALSANRITTYFQPIICNQTGKICSYEALVRLIDKDGSIVSPFHFLDIAKKNRQYPQITKIVIDHSIEIVKKKQVNISINLTIADLSHPETLNYIVQAITTSQTGHSITFEITESEGIENHQQINEFSKQIKELGCRLSIDDFGTGYSNFSHLIDLNADHLKIDGSIIKRLLTDPKAELVVATIVEYAKGMGMKTVAEFIDNPELLQKVIKMGIDYSQGFFLGKPSSETLADSQIDLTGLMNQQPFES
ncbi:EAL domain-containing protein [Catenovulum sp. 2E275]|uniref:ABC transporter substrate binding protein n=1 Tax=Catenovulum sp. 2E275 TaxID=2980497 RepID=UPI0021CE27B5|nr:ABC transporter substrate binding protein [Catenovulum sp. 2E275]MCU4676688.1 EAL domain-containing protein [Catenovulum sp. 2E275]